MYTCLSVWKFLIPSHARCVWPVQVVISFMKCNNVKHYQLAVVDQLVYHLSTCVSACVCLSVCMCMHESVCLPVYSRCVCAYINILYSCVGTLGMSLCIYNISTLPCMFVCIINKYIVT